MMTRDVRGIIFTGGDQFFSAGMDLNAAKDLGSPRKFNDFMNHWRRLNKAQEENAKPTIAAIEGFCLHRRTGTGARLRSARRLNNATLRSPARASVLSQAPVALNVCRASSAFQMLWKCCSRPSRFDAEHALRIGLINKKVENGQALAEAKKMVDLYAHARRSACVSSNAPFTAACRCRSRRPSSSKAFIVNTIYNSEDKLEGISAFLEKRPARFRGE